ncbi:hypothetical protein AWC05_12100 [Mycobacterium florentinum]|uniref:Uncharacterized protein n=1 Tax=Mycobacterium florentinum TaxID=292462 RepID=A0A1X1UGQ4_MYCFL|nr:hypothetical protein AWC05_12100 [Mycobacterium florentinum]
MASSERSDLFKNAQNHPTQLLFGLFAGFMSTLLTFGFLWFFAPILPLMLCGITMFFRRTKAFSVGALAAFAGVVAFVGSAAILIIVLSLTIGSTPPPSAGLH